METWSVVIFDEAQKVKNPAAMVTRAAKKLNARFRIACTGTPVENSLVDLWCLFDLVQPGLLGALDAFGRDYTRPIQTDTGNAKSLEQTERLRELISPQLIRRTKADVAKDLPRKIVSEPCTVALSDAQRALYSGVLTAYQAGVDAGTDGGKSERLHHLGVLQYLRLVCADPRPYDRETFVAEPLADYRRRAPKMGWLLKTLRAVQERREKALVFADYRDVQRLLQHYIGAEFGVVPKIINGDTAVSTKSAVTRQKLIDEFQSAAGFRVLILSPLAVGFGVNIQAANHVIHYLRHWNPAKEDQATDRAYRIGQTKDVYVYCPLTVANDFKTFDVRLDEILRSKRALAGDMLRGPDIARMPDIDIREILPKGVQGLRDEPITPERIARCNPRFFEASVAALWQRQGYDCQLTMTSGDAGVDVVGIRGSEGVLIQCKSSSIPDKALGWEGVRDVTGGAEVYSERHPTIRFLHIAATNQRFNQRARERARVNSVELVEGTHLANLITQHPITLLEVQRMLARQRV